MGAAITFTDIDGIGQKTADKLTTVIGIDAPRDVADYSAPELAREANISESRARKAIRGGGGNPSIDNRGSTGTVEAGNLAEQMDTALEQAAGTVQEQEAFFESLVSMGAEVPDRRERRRNPEANPFMDADPEQVQQIGQAADIFSTATGEPVDPTTDPPDLGFDEQDREEAATVRLAAQEALEAQQGIEFDEATSATRGSPSNPPAFDEVSGILTPAQRANILRSESHGRFLREPPEPAPDSPGWRKASTGRYIGYGIRDPNVRRDTRTGQFHDAGDERRIPKDEQTQRYGDPDGGTQTQPDRSGFAAHPEAAAGGSLQESFEAELAGRDIPMSPEEFRGVGLGSPSAPGGQGFKAGEGAVEIDRPDHETRPPEEALQQQASDGGNGGVMVQFPEWTLSRGQTYLNEKVFGDEREDLRPLRDKIRRADAGQSVELEKQEYEQFRQVVRDGAQEEIERADRMDANIFGDTDEQAEIAEQALQGIMNNPPR